MLSGVNSVSRTHYGYGRTLTVTASKLKKKARICSAFMHMVLKYRKHTFKIDSPKAMVYWRHHQIHFLSTEGMRKRVPQPRVVYLATRLTAQLFPGDLWVNVLFVACFRERSVNNRCISDRQLLGSLRTCPVRDLRRMRGRVAIGDLGSLTRAYALFALHENT